LSKLDNAHGSTSVVGKFLARFVGEQTLHNRTLLAVSLAVCAGYTGIGMIVPIRVLYAQSRGASLAIIGAMASAYLISNFIFQYPSGWIADRWGRKRIMVISQVGQAVLSLAYIFISYPVLFVVLRFTEGMVGAASLPSARALIADSVPAESRGEAYGVFSAFLNTGFLLGPAIGGLLASTGYASAFIAAVFFRLAAVVIVITMISTPGRVSREAQERAKAVPVRALFTLPLLGAYILALGDYLYLGFDLTLVPLWLHDHLGASIALIGLTYTAWAIPNIITSPLGGRLADRTRRSLLILIFGLAQVPIYLAYGLLSTAWPVAVLFAVHGAVYALIQPAVDAHVAASSLADARARVQSVYSAFGLLGSFIGASTLSILYGVNFRLPLFAMGAGFGICVVIGGVMIRISESRSSARPAEQHLLQTVEELEQQVD
jgi:MFS family permease